MSYDNTKFSSVTLQTYKDNGTDGGRNEVGAYGGYASDQTWRSLRITFVPRVDLSAVSFTLHTTGHQTLRANAFTFGFAATASTTVPAVSALQNPYTPSIPVEQAASTAMDVSYTVTGSFTAGQSYYLWLTANYKNSYSLLKHANGFELDGTAPAPVVDEGLARIYGNGAWGKYEPRIRVSGAWGSYEPYAYSNGQWRKMV